MGMFKDRTNKELEILFDLVDNIQLQIGELASFVNTSSASAEVTSNRMNIVNTSLNKVEDQVDHFRKFLAESPVYNEALVNHTLSDTRRNSQNADTILAQRITKLEAFIFEPVESSMSASIDQRIARLERIEAESVVVKDDEAQTITLNPLREHMSDFQKDVLNDIHGLQIDQRVNKKRSEVDAKRIVELADAANELIHRVSELELNAGETINAPSDVVHDILALTTEAEQRDNRINSVADQLNGLHRSIRNTIDALDDRITDVGNSLANDITEVGDRGFQDKSVFAAFRSRLEDVEDSIDEQFPKIYENIEEIENKADNACLDVASINVHERMQDSWIKDLSERAERLEQINNDQAVSIKQDWVRDNLNFGKEVYSDHLHPYTHRLAYSLSNGDRMAYDAAYYILMKLDEDEAKQLMRLCKITFESFPERFITE